MESRSPNDESRSLSEGEVLADRYEVEGLIGVGGMGAVYRVFDRMLGERVALKVLARTSPAAIERFSREVRLGRKVTHPNIVRTHDLGEDRGLHFLTMALVEGRSLDGVLAERGAFPPEEVVPLGVAIASGLHAAHEAGVIHRDLKPANVLLGDDGRVLVTDFGIARAADTSDRTHDDGTVLGTPHYMAPEQVSGQTVDERTDLYALGCILYELLTGAPPFEGPTPMAVVSQRLLHEAPEDPRQRAAVPDPLAELVMRCLRREPGERPGSASLVAEALGSGAALTSGSGRMSLFAPLPVQGQPSVAVLPFRYRGPAEHDYLGEGLAEELIDVLSRTRGLKVLALGATQPFEDDRDPRRVGRELRAHAVVDGTVTLGGERVRLSARLIDASGVQIYSEVFEGDFSDVLAFQESMGRRVAEALRLEVEAAHHRREAPEEAVALYLRGRRGLMADVMDAPERAEADLERSLELAPRMKPAIAALAMASVRAWWGRPDPEGERAERAMQNVWRAMEDAPSLGETHLARAMLAGQTGDFHQVAQSVMRALELVPTLSFAHYYLGALQIEAGREREGRERLELALELDPSLHAARFSLARLDALQGRWESHERHLAQLTEVAGGMTMPLCGLRFRSALWRGDREQARRWWQATAELPTPIAARTAEVFAVGVGEGDADAAEAIVDATSDPTSNLRFRSLILQIAAEIFAASGHTDRALAMVERAAESALVDVVWLRRCPLFADVHDHPSFQSALRTVDRRAREVWRR